MEIKHAIYSVVGVGAVGALAFFAWKKWGAQMSAAPETQAAEMQPVTASAPPAYTPISQSYSPGTFNAPTPVGVNTGASSSTPPGVPSSQITVNHPGAGNANVDDSHYGPSPSQLSNPAHDQLVTGTGQAAVPTNAISSAPANAGNASLIDAEYMKIFGRHAESQGLAYWQNAMDSGVVSAADLERELMRGARGSDINKAVVNNPVGYISAFTPK